MPTYASRKGRRSTRLVHIAPWDTFADGCRPYNLCATWQHPTLTPPPLSAITCPNCLWLWDRGFRRRESILRYYPVPGSPLGRGQQFYTVPDVPPVARPGFPPGRGWP